MINLVDRWKKRIIAKRGPFFLIEKTKVNGINTYHVAWSECSKQRIARLGYFTDGMMCRYGINTYCSTRGVSPFDIYYGSCDPDIFKILASVFNDDISGLEVFDLDILKNLKH